MTCFGESYLWKCSIRSSSSVLPIRYSSIMSVRALSKPDAERSRDLWTAWKKSTTLLSVRKRYKSPKWKTTSWISWAQDSELEVSNTVRVDCWSAEDWVSQWWRGWVGGTLGKTWWYRTSNGYTHTSWWARKRVQVDDVIFIRADHSILRQFSKMRLK